MIEVVFEYDPEEARSALGKKHAGKEVRVQLHEIQRGAKPRRPSGVHPCLGLVGIGRDAGPVGNHEFEKQAKQYLQKSPLKVFFFKGMPFF